MNNNKYQNIEHLIYSIDASSERNETKNKLSEVWGKYVGYHIHNVTVKDIESFYVDLAQSVGTVKETIDFNGSNKKSLHRDIKYDPSAGNRYFAANTRQPLHTDYAYYAETDAPDWLLLFCMDISEFGGMTHILTLNRLKYILEKYNPELINKLNIDVVWEYSGASGQVTHTRKLFDGNTINWNYYQIKENLNSPEVIKVRDEFFEFMETYVQAARCFNLSKQWKRGDGIIFNDHLALHARDAFLGNDRWLKDLAIYEK